MEHVLAVNMIAVLKKFGSIFKNYRAAMLDRANTNKRCIDQVESKTNSTITRAYCTSHSLNKPGAAMYKATLVAKKAREKYNSAICVRGKLSDHIKVETGRSPFRSSPVRWYADWE